MKKLLLLPLAFFLLCQLVFAQQKKSSSFLDKIKSKSPAYRSQLTAHRSPLLPAPNSIWQPGKMIESSWDTVGNTWMFFDSTLYSYNINGDVTLESMCFTSVPECQTVYTYNANAKLIETLRQYWNGSSWDNSNQYLYTYDANNNLIQETNQNWNTSLSSWDNSYQYLYAYDVNNNRIQYLGQTWNTSTSVWDNQWKEDDTYNVNNELIQLLGYNWNGASWDNQWKEDLTYTSGVVTYAIDYIWNGTSWDNAYQIINIVWYQWTGDLNTSLIQSYVQQDWNGTSWYNAYRVTCTYDAQGNNTDVLVEMWQTSAWVTFWETKNIYAYDANNNIAQNIVQDWVPWLMAVRNSWKIDYSNYNLYSGINESSWANDNIIVYPNPTSGICRLSPTLSQGEGVAEVYSVLGKRVFSLPFGKGGDGLLLDLSEVPSGVYFLHLKPVVSGAEPTGQGIATKKIVISH